MGVCINYRGTLKSPKKVFEFIEEIEDICKILEWRYTIIDEDWTKPSDIRFTNDPITQELEIVGNAYLKGIIFTPPDCESMQFLFDDKGKMTDLTQKAIENSFKKERSVYQWTKTQFAGAEVHITLIGLLKYIKKAYMPNLTVKDEGEYWETENRELLEQNMGIINSAIEIIEGIAQNSDSIEGFLDKLENWLKNRLKNKEDNS